MRTIKGWTKEEQKELEWQKDSGNGFDEAVDTLYDRDSSGYLFDKYNNNNNTKANTQQMIFDMVDYWRGDAKFPEKKYYIHLSFFQGLTNLYRDKQGGGLIMTYRCEDTNTAQVQFTMQEIKDIDEHLVPFAVEVKDENSN